MENEEKYKGIKAEILGDEEDEEDESSGSEESSDEDEGALTIITFQFFHSQLVIIVVEEKEGIEDRTETNLVNLRRIIYLTIMNALNYEEAVHKLLKIQLEEGQEVRSYPS